MKISVDDKELFTLSDIQKKVICNDINDDIFEEDMKRRLQYIIMHKYDQCLSRLKSEWDSKLKERYDAIPTDPNKLCEMIFAQPDYKCRKTRESANDVK